MTTALDNLRAAARALVEAEVAFEEAIATFQRHYDTPAPTADSYAWHKTLARLRAARERASAEVENLQAHVLDLARQWAQEDDGGSSV